MSTILSKMEVEVLIKQSQNIQHTSTFRGIHVDFWIIIVHILPIEIPFGSSKTWGLSNSFGSSRKYPELAKLGIPDQPDPSIEANSPGPSDPPVYP